MTERVAGFYSAQALTFGSNIWLGEDGKEYEITAVDHPSKYMWPDKVEMPVKMVRWLRHATPPTKPDLVSWGHRFVSDVFA
jgi:hypothetical protein